MLLSKNTFSISSILFWTPVLTVFLSILVFCLTGCSKGCNKDEGVNPTTGCTFAGAHFLLAHDQISIMAGSSEYVGVEVEVLSPNCDSMGQYFALGINEPNPAGITIEGCGRQVMNNNLGNCILEVEVPTGTPDGIYELFLGVRIYLGSNFAKDVSTSLQINVGSTAGYSLSILHSFGVAQGRSYTVATDVIRSGGHDESIDLSLWGGLPGSVSYTFTPNPVPGNEVSSQLTFTVDQSAVPGSFELGVVGVDNSGVEKFDYFDFHILEPFTLGVSPNSISIMQGESNTVVVSATQNMGGWAETVFLTVEGEIIGQGPNSVDTTFNPNPIPPQDIHSSVLTLSVGQSVPPGTYPLTIKGTTAYVVKSIDVQLTVTE